MYRTESERKYGWEPHADGTFWLVERGERRVVSWVGSRPPDTTEWTPWSEHATEAEARAEMRRLSDQEGRTPGWEGRAQWRTRSQIYLNGRPFPPTIARYG